MTYTAAKLSPPPKTDDWRELYRWQYRVFELLNGIQSILGTGVEVTPVGLITATTLQSVIGQVNTLLATLQAVDAAHVSALDPHPQYLTEAEGDAVYAVISKGVTNGDAHDHNGGDGAQIDHVNLSNIGTNTHTQIDTKITALTGLTVRANNAAAIAAGIPVGGFYRTGADPSVVCVVV